jgi:hypothetical protein
LALFILPKIENDNKERNKANKDQETISTRTGSYSEAIRNGIFPTGLAEPTETIAGIHEEGHEAEIGLSELQLSENNSAERQDSEWFANGN